MTLPDGSLGCPQPGLAYTQMIVDGYKSSSKAGGRTPRLSVRPRRRPRAVRHRRTRQDGYGG